MNGFRTARALVIDDEDTEAIAAIRALGLLNIGCVLHREPPREESFQKYTGIRLLVLDMVLENLGAPANDAQSAISVLMGLLGELLDPRTDTLVAICWTKHAEMAATFQHAFKKTFSSARLATVITVEKADISDPEKLDELKDRISEAFSQDGAHSLLRHWEQVVHDAASETSGTLFGLTHASNPSPNGWLQNSYTLAAALALAERGQRLEKEGGTEVARAFTNTLSPLLADRIEHANHAIYSEADASVQDKLIQAVRGMKKKQSDAILDGQKQAQLNTCLHISFDATADDVVPGTVFAVQIGHDNQRLLLATLSKELIEEASEESFSAKPQKSIPVIVELTAPCDHAQARKRLHRFCLGFLYTHDKQDPLRKGDSRKLIGRFRLSHADVEDDSYALMFNCHYIFGVSHSVCKQLQPLFRVRGGIFADIMSWQATQSSRPGYILLR